VAQIRNALHRQNLHHFLEGSSSRLAQQLGFIYSSKTWLLEANITTDDAVRSVKSLELRWVRCPKAAVD
jgi:hypothetical protein